MIEKRIEWIDVAKCLGIILVVVGHLQNQSPGGLVDRLQWAIFLFHMPLFFMLSGMTHRPKDVVRSARAKFYALMLPYFSFFALLAIYTIASAILLTGEVAEKAAGLGVGLILGGRYLGGNLGVFWFVPILFLVFLLYDALAARLPSHVLAAVAVISFACAPWISQLVGDRPIPWLVNALPVAFAYFWTGGAIRRFMDRRIVTLSLAAAALMICFAASHFLHVRYSMNIKYGDFGPFILGPIAAISLSVIFMQICQLLHGKIFVWIGQRSMTIMFLHIAVLILAGQFHVPALIAIIAAIALPLIFHIIVERWSITRTLFLGRPNIRLAKEANIADIP